MIKIIHLIFSLNTGGTENMLIDILNEQSKTEQVHLIIVNNLYEKALISTISPKVDIHTIDRSEGSNNIFKLLELTILLFKLKADIIHCHNHNLIKLIWYRGIAKICFTAHTTNLPTINLPKYHKIFSISKGVKKDILTRANLQSQVVYNGINYLKIKNISESTENSFFSIVQISRLKHEDKGQHVLLHALQRLVGKGYKNLRLHLIGDGPSLSYLKLLTAELDLVTYVSFLGNKPRDYIYSNLKNYNLLVQPSINEGFGLTIVEGMAAKIPVVISNIEGPLEVIDQGRFGYKFVCNNYKSCAEAIENVIILKNSKELRNKVELAFDHVVQKFSIQNTSDSYLQEYRKLLH